MSLPTVPREEIESRLVRAQAGLREAGVDGALIQQRADLVYLTGTAQNGVLILPAAAGAEELFAVQKSRQRAREESPIARQEPLDSPRDLPRLLGEAGLAGATRLGLELDVLPVRDYFRLREILGGVELVDVSMPIRELRTVKSRWEITQMDAAAAILHLVFREVPAILKSSEREIDACAAVEASLRRHGHQALVRVRRWNMELAGATLVSGPSASYPQPFDGADGQVGLYPAAPSSGSERPLRPGEAIMVDLVAGYGGYLVDKTRIFALGRLDDPELREAHRLALAIQAETARRLRPGTLCSSIYNEILEMVAGTPWAGGFMGWGENQVAFLGHGVGLELDELPVLTARSRTRLAAGMTIAVEPKFFFGDRGGVGVENSWVVGEKGARNLTSATGDEIVEV